MNYYNENDPFCVEWLKNLIAAKLIPTGDVDARSILDVTPNDLRSYRQCHFFAGIGGWAYALALADFPVDREVWTGSCPCQPFSAAGKGGGFDDERDLWPFWNYLISQQQPPTIFGEQVASKAGREWLARVHTDLEATGYSFGAADLCAAGASAPHCRQRHFFVANAERVRVRGARSTAAVGTPEGMQGADGQRERFRADARPDGLSDGVGDTNGYHQHWWSGPLQVGRNAIESVVERSGRQHRAQWRIKPGISIVANGVSARHAKLCAIGNAIVPQVAAEFVKAYLES